MGNVARGCERCRDAALSNTWPPTRRVAVRAGPAFLNVCDYCGAYWEFELGVAVVLDTDSAHRKYPEYFRLKER